MIAFAEIKWFNPDFHEEKVYHVLYGGNTWRDILTQIEEDFGDDLEDIRVTAAEQLDMPEKLFKIAREAAETSELEDEDYPLKKVEALLCDSTNSE